MKRNNFLKAKIILAVYLTATLVLLLFGYSIQKPAVSQQEFPFSVTYSYLGETETIQDVYVAEYASSAKYIGDNALSWSGCVKDRNKLEPDFYRVAEQDGRTFSVNLNLVPGYLMGDPAYAGSECQPTLQCNSFDGQNDIVITDPAELEQLGFTLVRWEYPQPIENSFSFGGLSLSSEAVLFTSVLAISALLFTVILIRKDPDLTLGVLGKVSAALNFLIIFLAFPFCLIVAFLSEIVADTSFLQQLLYLSPALTAAGIAASVALRRMGHRIPALLIQFVGPAVFALILLLDLI